MPHLTMTESAQLLPVLALGVCAQAEARALVIKGQTAEHHGLRGPRQSADVDLLVEPTRHSLVVDALCEAGWSVVEVNAPRANAPKGVLLTHPLWPQTIDLHYRFTGFTEKPDTVFDALWDERTSIELAGCPVNAAGPATACLIQTLHALPNSQSSRRKEFLPAAEWLLTASPSLQKLTVTLAEATGAASTAFPLFESAAIPVYVDEATTARGRRFRRSAAGADNFMVHYLLALLREPARHWPALALRFAIGKSQTLVRRYPYAARGRQWLWLARGHRVVDGLRKLPHAVWTIIRTR